MDAAYAAWNAALWYAFALSLTYVAVFVTGTFFGSWLAHRAFWLAYVTREDETITDIPLEDDDDAE